MSSILSDEATLLSVKEPSRPRYKKVWNEFKVLLLYQCLYYCYLRIILELLTNLNLVLQKKEKFSIIFVIFVRKVSKYFVLYCKICIVKHIGLHLTIIILGMASSSLWTMYSMVNSVTKVKYSLSLKAYPRITSVLKSMDVDCKKKAKTFNKQDFDKFIENKAILTPYWLVRKVNLFIILHFHIFGLVYRSS